MEKLFTFLKEEKMRKELSPRAAAGAGVGGGRRGGDRQGRRNPRRNPCAMGLWRSTRG